MTELFNELEQLGVKYNRADVLFVVRDKTGQIVWLEKGNELAGLKHIVLRHADDFKRAFDIDADNIAEYLRRVIENGAVVSNNEILLNGRRNYSRRYYYEGHYYIVTGIGSNGFIVSAYPQAKA